MTYKELKKADKEFYNSLEGINKLSERSHMIAVYDDNRDLILKNAVKEIRDIVETNGKIILSKPIPYKSLGSRCGWSYITALTNKDIVLADKFGFTGTESYSNLWFEAKPTLDLLEALKNQKYL